MIYGAYNINFASGVSDNSNVQVANGNIRIKGFERYTVWIHDEYGDNVYSSNIYPVDTNKFTAELKRNQHLYMLYYETPLPELEKLNGEMAFDIKVTEHMTDKLIPNKEFTSNWHTDRAGKEQTFGNDAKFHLYEQVDVTFYCKETGLNVKITIPVPPMDDLSDVTAIITEPGTIQLTGKLNNDIISIKELNNILGYSANTSSTFHLYYNGGSGPLDDGNMLTNEIIFDNFLGGVLDTPEGIENAADLVNWDDLMSIYDYWEAVKNSPNKDCQLYLRVKDASNKIHTIYVEDPTVGNYRQFEAITGIDFEEFEELMGYLEVEIPEHVTEVSGSLHITSDEEFKNFRVPDGGIYYLEQQVNGDIISTVPFVTLPLPVGASEASLAFAGRYTGEEKDGKPLGEYIYYTSGTVDFGEDELLANCFPLIGGLTYRIYNRDMQDITINFTHVEEDDMGNGLGLVEIVNQRDSTMNIRLQSQNPKYSVVSPAYILPNNLSLFEALGSMLARFVRTLANGLNYLVQFSLQSVTGEGTSAIIDIDSIIFNHYPDTSIAFFNSNTGSDNPSRMISMFRDGINNWYSVFNAIAIAGYIVILLYIGVRILLGVGGTKRAQYKEMLTGWVVGLVLLAFFPYVVRYAIELNNLLVSMIEDSKTGALNITDIQSEIDMSDFTLPSMAKEEDYNKLASQMDKNPYEDGDNSYMAYMSKRTHENPTNLVDAVVYLIMVWQFIMIVIMYYKRVFVIAFLIAIFPFVALSYALDKIGDGHAGAFSTWSREIMVNIFVQSIHAIVYVFVIGATYQGNAYSGDWLLSIIGIMFLFRGEEILKRILGFGGEGTIKSLGKTAQRAIKTITAAKLATTSIADNVIGAKSHLGRTVGAYREWRSEKLIARNMDFLAPDKRTPPPRADELETYDKSRSWDHNYNTLAKDIQILNNRDNAVDAETLARALDNVMANMNSSDVNIQNLMQGLNLSDEQLNELANLQASMVSSFIDGDRSTNDKRSELKETIDKELEARLKIIFPESRERQDLLKRAMYFRLRDGNRDEKHKPRSTSHAKVQAEYEKAKERRNRFYDPRLSSENPFSDEVTPSMLSNDAMARRDSVLSTYFNKSMSNATEKEKRFAESIAILKEFSDTNHRSRFNSRDANRYTAKQMMDAANYLAEHQKDSPNYNNAVMMNLGLSGKDARAIIAEEVGKQYTDGMRANISDFREDLKKDEGFKKPSPTSGTAIERLISARDAEHTWRDVIKIIKDDEKKAGDKHCYEETIDVVDVKDVMRKERETHYDEATYIDYIVAEREIRNEEEISLIEAFAREQLEDLPQINTAPTYDGLTKEEHEELANDLRAKLMEEFGRTIFTTTGVVLGSSIGAGLNIGLSDDSSAFEEAFTGAALGAAAGDYLTERAMGRETSVKKVKILNPYTGQVEDFELRKEGFTKDSAWVSLINNNEILRYDDPRLDSFNYNLDMQYRKHKRDAEREREAERKRNLYTDALRNNRNS